MRTDIDKVYKISNQYILSSHYHINLAKSGKHISTFLEQFVAFDFKEFKLHKKIKKIKPDTGVANNTNSHTSRQTSKATGKTRREVCIAIKKVV